MWGQYQYRYPDIRLRVFSKDVDGCIHPDEIKFVLKHLPGRLEAGEIEEMIDIVDKNKDGKISYSEFRVDQNMKNLNWEYVSQSGDVGGSPSPYSWGACNKTMKPGIYWRIQLYQLVEISPNVFIYLYLYNEKFPS